jgi:hypothetical protein
MEQFDCSVCCEVVTWELVFVVLQFHDLMVQKESLLAIFCAVLIVYPYLCDLMWLFGKKIFLILVFVSVWCFAF